MAPRSRCGAARLRAPQRLFPVGRICYSLGLVLILVSTPWVARGVTRDVTGKWTPNSISSSPNYAIHMMLLRGDATYHSRILWWNSDQDSGFSGGEWGWNPGGDCDSYPTTSFTSISVPSTYGSPSNPTPGMNVFCGGHAPLPDGRMLMAGGSDSLTGIYGDNETRLWTDGTGTASGSWSDAQHPGPMAQWRWYPTLTTLADGRVLVLAGDSDRHHRIFGGRHDGSPPASPTGDSLYRFSPVTNGQWDRSVLPTQDPTGPPPVREAHSAVSGEELNNVSYPGIVTHVIFGGKDANGNPLGDLWFQERTLNVQGNDYAYDWKKKVPYPLLGNPPPSPRSHHSAIVIPGDAGMFVWGGRGQSRAALQDSNVVYRLYGFGGLQWLQITTSGTQLPSPRFAHAAIYDGSHLNGSSVLTERMIMFGGIGADGQTPSDNSVWELRLASDYNSATWYKMTVIPGNSSDRRPLPRFGQTMVWDGGSRYNAFAHKNGHVGFMFGGQLGSGAFSDTLWALWIFDDLSVGWEPRTFGGTAPSARARHSAVLDRNQGFVTLDQHPVFGLLARLYIFGGDSTVTSQAAPIVYVVDPWAANPTWTAWASAGFKLSGQSATLDKETEARTAEAYGSASGWQPLSNSTLLQNTYPPAFLIPGGTSAGGRVLSLGVNDSTYYLDVASSAPGNPWSRLTNGYLGFTPESGVLYRPNQIMVAGGADDDTNQVVGKTKTLDATNLNNNPSWQASGLMAPRSFTNLVLLPDGKVVAVGGMAATDVSDLRYPVKRPQIWDPAGGGGAGAWTDPTILDQQPTMRNYHSTAILLPDGRVLSAGGDFQDNRYYANLYCPPYLFNGDALAARPANTTPPMAHASWKKVFTICCPSAATVKSVCLIRPGATTHAFDENQRYVPLTFTPATSPTRLLVTAPLDSTYAPPGDYLMFIVDSSSVATPRVPSVATWLKLDRLSGRDSCDTVAPSTITDVGVVAIAPTSVLLDWTAVGDDAVLPAAGAAAESDLRYSSSAINSSNWNSASQATGEPAPQVPGGYDGATAGGLHSCTTYHFAVKIRDDNYNLSGVSNDVQAKTMCSGGGGGFSAQGAGGGDEPGLGAVNSGSPSAVGRSGSVARSASSAPSPGGLQSGGGVVIFQTERSEKGAWQVSVRQVSSSDGLGVTETDGMVFQSRDASGAWVTRRRFALGTADDVVGLCALHERGRVVFLGTWQVQQVAASIHAGASDYVLSAATQSGVGDLGPGFITGGGGVTVTTGDTLNLVYQPSPTALASPSSWFAIFGRAATGALSLQPRTPAAAPAIPVRFALHQNQPNPFGSSTNIRFDLPVGEVVRLEVFDAGGRRVATLANHYFEPGYQNIVWEPRSSPGSVGPGVYFYRIEAGPFRERRKAVLLP